MTNEPLTPPDSFLLRAAEGWLDLGNPREANLELEQVSRELRDHPEFLLVQWHVRHAEKDWTACVQVAEALTRRAEREPHSWILLANSLYFAKRTQEAYDLANSKLEDFPGAWPLRYNLACYACQLGHMDEARSWLAKASEMGNAGAIQKQARQDPDLSPLWASDPKSKPPG